MNDKILDDDDIIDLTDLLEEGDAKPAKEKKAEGSPMRNLASEPDSFDLGKEISMEYDVSVEEIESDGATLDIDAALSSGEEIALSSNEENSGEFTVSDDGRAEAGFEFDDAASPAEPERDVPPADGEPGLSDGDEDAARLFDREDFPAGKAKEGVREKSVEEILLDDASRDLFDETEPESPPEYRDEVKTAGDRIGGGEEEPPITEVPVQEAGEPVPERVLEDFRQEIPAMLESMLRPLVSEFVRETIAATREQLPGIIEKIIREEIEKLKKLDS